MINAVHVVIYSKTRKLIAHSSAMCSDFGQWTPGTFA